MAIMKKALLMIAALLLFSCKKDSEKTYNEPSNTQSWVLVEEYFDPGDGSGDFVATENGFTIQWYDNNEFSATGNLCSLWSEEGESSSGTFDIDEQEIIVSNCVDGNPIQLRYELTDDGELLVYYSCIEPCILKFLQVIAL